MLKDNIATKIKKIFAFIIFNTLLMQSVIATMVKINAVDSLYGVTGFVLLITSIGAFFWVKDSILGRLAYIFIGVVVTILIFSFSQLFYLPWP